MEHLQNMGDCLFVRGLMATSHMTSNEKAQAVTRHRMNSYEVMVAAAARAVSSTSAHWHGSMRKMARRRLQEAQEECWVERQPALVLEQLVVLQEWRWGPWLAAGWASWAALLPRPLSQASINSAHSASRLQEL